MGKQGKPISRAGFLENIYLENYRLPALLPLCCRSWASSMTLGAAFPLMWGPVHWLHSGGRLQVPLASTVLVFNPCPGLCHWVSRWRYEGSLASVDMPLRRPMGGASTGALSSSCLEAQGWKRGELM